MARYGNILTIHFPQPNQLALVQTILQAQKTNFEIVDTTFFVETKSLEHTRTVESRLAATTLTYTFFHNRNCDGSFMKTSINNPTTAQRIKKILFE